jgi:hypothetical protein
MVAASSDLARYPNERGPREGLMLTQCLYHTLVNNGIYTMLLAHRAEYVRELIKEEV